ncbi:MAG: aspartate aminotransferase family protein [Candidatus Binatia bacterium]
MNPGQLYSAFLANVAQTSVTPVGIVVERARGCSITAAGGQEYIDLLAGIGVAALGHQHPRVLEAIQEQAHRHLHVMVYGEYVQRQQVELARRLAELLPPPLESVYFTNSGSEAVEGALKLARKLSGRSSLLAFRGAFHGDTLGAVSIGGNPVYRDPFEPLLPGVGFMEFNEVDSLDAINEDVAAVIVEPVQAEAGVVLPKPGFLPELRRRCTEAGTLLIFDEVITGLGRTGRLFALEHERVVPDVLLLAKALGGGLPLGAFVSSKRAMRCLAVDPPLGHVTTFGGHPLSCAAGLAALEVIVEEDLSTAASDRGGFFAELLRERLAGDALLELRQIGLLLGLEMASAATAAAFTKECLREGLILGWTLHDDCVVRLAPPLVISESELDEASLRMQRALARVTADG